MIDELSVLRECRRVLRAGGRLAMYTIHLAPDLSPAEEARALALGPKAVGTGARPWASAEVAGLEVVAVEDVTGELAATSAAVLRARLAAESELRAQEGDEQFEEEVDRDARLSEGIAAGLIRRSLVIARA